MHLTRPARDGHTQATGTARDGQSPLATITPLCVPSHAGFFLAVLMFGDSRWHGRFDQAIAFSQSVRHLQTRLKKENEP